MKSIILATTCFLSVVAFAQPSKETVIKEVKSGNPKIYKVVVSNPDKRLEKGVYKYFFRVNSHIKTDYPGITRVYYCDRVYAGKNYERSTVGSNQYFGIPDPDLTVFEAHINKYVDNILGNEFRYVIGKEMPKVKFPDNNNFIWSGWNGTTFLIELEYETMNETTRKVVKKRGVYSVGFQRSTDGKTFDSKAKYLPDGKWIFHEDRPLYGSLEEEDILSTRIAPDSEEITFLTDYFVLKKTQEKLEKLPKVTIPTFENSYDAIKFVHASLMEGDVAKMEAILYQMAGDHYFVMPEEKVLNVRGDDFFKAIKASTDIYRDYFCDFPQIKHKQEGLVQFYTRNLSSFNRISVRQHGAGNWKIEALEIPSNRTNRLDASKAAENQNCGEEIKVIKLEKFSIGDQVVGIIRGREYKGKIEKIDNMMADRYFVRFEGTSAQWITGDNLSRDAGGSSTKSSPSPDSNSPDKNSKEDGKEKIKKGLRGLKDKIGG